MVKAVAWALKDAGFKHGTFVARNPFSGKKLADLYGYDWQLDMAHVQADMLINVTPIGMAGGPAAQTLPFGDASIDIAQMIFDVVALPTETPLIRYAKSRDKRIITDAEVFAIQAVEQFVLYTGIRPIDEIFQLAAKYSRA